MEGLSVEVVGGAGLAREAVHHYRSLRAAAIAVRNGIDVPIATFCIESDHAVLHRDRALRGFEHCGLRVWRH